MFSKTWIGIGALVLSNNVLAKPVFLTCDTVWGYSNKSVMDFEIDEAKRTVDSDPAVFTEKLISFDRRLDGGVVISTTISRVSGEITFMKDKEIIGNGKCSVVNTKKF